MLVRIQRSHAPKNRHRRWWWEDFRLPSEAWRSPDSCGYRSIPRVVPDPNDVVWFIVEDDSLARYPVFEGSVSTICAVIGECFAFEYYLVSKAFDWLVCENHHDVIIGVGSPVAELVANLAAGKEVQD